MMRREFVTLVGGAAVACPLAAGAQLGERIRRIGVLTSLAASDPEAKLRITALKRELAGLGWIEERNLRIDARWPGDDPRELRFYADELLGLKPDVMVAVIHRRWRRSGRKPAYQSYSCKFPLPVAVESLCCV
jgi:putative ABC transport system substrate-binding protein